MAKEQKQTENGNGEFPKALEVLKCREGNKEFMRERPARRPFGRTILVCEYPVAGYAEFGTDDNRIVWKLAKRAARDFLRVSFMTAAIVTAVQSGNADPVVRVYGRY